VAVSGVDPVLRLRDVGVRYRGARRAALEGVSLEVAPGEGVALLGANGAGKTTTLRLAMALLHPTTGSVSVAGEVTSRLGPEDLAGRVGYLFQRPEDQLFERTVRRELAFGPQRLGWDAQSTSAAVDRVLDELGITAVAESHPYDLPTPARRLVALASTLVTGPDLLLLDEPTAGLDRTTRGVVRDVVRARRAAGAGVLAVTHDAEFVLEVLGRAVVLDDGRVVADAAPTTVFEAGGRGVPAWPPYADVSLQLGLRPASLRLADVAEALAERCRGTPSSLS
jgi:energy-coupling factor transport system ATP-binding protein